MQSVTPHVLRHTFATLALQKGISLAAVQKILGHDRLATTAIYLNLVTAQGEDIGEGIKGIPLKAFVKASKGLMAFLRAVVIYPRDLKNILLPW